MCSLPLAYSVQHTCATGVLFRKDLISDRLKVGVDVVKVLT